MTAAALADFSSFIKQPERLITSSIEGERERDRRWSNDKLCGIRVQPLNSSSLQFYF